MFKRLILFLLSMLIVINNNASIIAVETINQQDYCSKKDLELYAKAAVLIDGDTGRILYEKEANLKCPMASTTKIMTCIIALEYGNLNDIVEFSDYAASRPKVRMGVKAGEKYKLSDLLYSLMLESHNDTAVAIAEHISGSVEKFCRLMTEKAQNIGAKNTNFVTPNGLDEKEHYSTAYDMALIGAYAIKNKEFVEIINTKNYSFNEMDGKRSVSLSNTNAFLGMMDGAIGVKTGFTGLAGYCFVGAIKKDNKNLISVVFGSGWPPNKNYKWRDTLSLMNYGIENYKYKKIFDCEKIYKSVAVENGKKDSVKTKISGECSMLISEFDKVLYKAEMMESTDAPVKRNTVVGYVNILVNNETVSSIPIKTMDDVEKTDLKYFIIKVFKLILP